MNHKEFSGQVALVTGGSRGIGLSIANELAHRGADIAFNYLKNHQAATEAEKQIKSQGVRCLRIRAHLGEEAAIESIIKNIEQEFGYIDILVNNAASGVMKNSKDLTVKHWDWTMGINARGPWLLTREAVRLMKPGSRVINISSPGSNKVLPAYFGIGVSKAALEAVTRYMAIELAEFKISVNAISAGFINTDALKSFPQELGIEKLAKRPTPSGRPVSKNDVANVVAMLCGVDAEMIRGQIIMVDGGETIQHL